MVGIMRSSEYDVGSALILMRVRVPLRLYLHASRLIVYQRSLGRGFGRFQAVTMTLVRKYSS